MLLNWNKQPLPHEADAFVLCLLYLAALLPTTTLYLKDEHLSTALNYPQHLHVCLSFTVSYAQNLKSPHVHDVLLANIPGSSLNLDTVA